jgi:hypothetical protein
MRKWANLSWSSHVKLSRKVLWKKFWSYLNLESDLQTRAANSGQNHFLSRILYFHTNNSNGNILSFWYQNQEIQKPKFIYTSSTITFMKDSKSDKIILKDRIHMQSGWLKWVPWSDSKTNGVEHPNITESLT